MSMLREDSRDNYIKLKDTKIMLDGLEVHAVTSHSIDSTAEEEEFSTYNQKEKEVFIKDFTTDVSLEFNASRNSEGQAALIKEIYQEENINKVFMLEIVHKDYITYKIPVKCTSLGENGDADDILKRSVNFKKSGKMTIE